MLSDDPKAVTTTEEAPYVPAEGQEADPSEVKVDLAAPKSPAVEPKEPAKTTEPTLSDVQRDLKHLQNQLAGARRINEQNQRLIKELREPRTTPAPATPSKDDAELTDADLETMIESGRGLEVARILARRETESILQRQKAAEDAARVEAQRLELYERSRNSVVSLYQELQDDEGDTEVHRLWNEANQRVMNDPEKRHYFQQVDGPRLVMHEMEQLMLERNLSPRSLKPSGVPTSKRTAAGFPPSRSSPRSNVYVLTKEQKQLCDEHGWKYEDFAKHANQLDTTGGIEVP